MMRLTLILCVGLFCAMKIGGQDNGQLRFGLMAQPDDVAPRVDAVAAVTKTVSIPVQPKAEVVVFTPSEPVMATPVSFETTTAVEPAPAVDTGKVLFIGAKSVNVRTGPGKDFAVISRLARGEAVLVVAEGEGPEGWSLIRIEGDGIEGYVASRLLTE